MTDRPCTCYLGTCTGNFPVNRCVRRYAEKFSADRIEQQGQRIAELEGALREIAEQKTDAELTREERETGDYQDAYNLLIEVARKALDKSND